MKLLQTLVVVGLACAAFAAPSLDSAVLKTIDTQKTADILVSFKGADVAAVRAQSISRAPLGAPARGVRAQMIVSALMAHANSTQSNVLSMLKRNARVASDMVVKSFWITNQIGIKRADLSTIASLLSMDEISAISEAGTASLVQPVSFEPLPENYVHAGEQWGILNVEAPAVWAQGNKGEGVVIANIDSGARATHVALAAGFRADHGWYDPAEGHSTPHDGNGHGTHTLGTMVGRENGIGVAPGAQWISCKGLSSSGSGSFVDLIDCGQFMACPTESDGTSNPKCELAPHAVSNSWGGGQGSTVFDEVMKTWTDLGIAPIFAAGNEGTSCGTTSSPGDSALAITVGAIDNGNLLTYFSSVGPTVRGLMKPNVAAPGLNVVSAGIANDMAYSSSSGTSMATPHVAGLTALLYKKRSNLTVAQVKSVLEGGAQHTVATRKTCGGISDTDYPNNHVGHGRVSARASVEQVNRMFY